MGPICPGLDNTPSLHSTAPEMFQRVVTKVVSVHHPATLTKVQRTTAWELVTRLAIIRHVSLSPQMGLTLNLISGEAPIIPCMFLHKEELGTNS